MIGITLLKWFLRNLYHFIIVALCLSFAIGLERIYGQEITIFVRIIYFLFAGVSLEIVVFFIRRSLRNSRFSRNSKAGSNAQKGYGKDDGGQA